MRHLVECSRCSIQYDATGYAVGSRFHCHCGFLVEVQAPAEHQSLNVVSCSNCGGNREGEAISCAYCKADFTLMDRDLGIICGHCSSRTGRKAKFCHRCGTAVAPQESIGKMSEIPCRRCEGKMLTRRVLDDGVFIHECDTCTGIWMKRSTFSRIEKRSLNIAELLTPTLDLTQAGETISTANVSRYIKCPECDVLMNRINYQRVSGIVIDVCKSHGVWFDGGELASLIDFLRSGGSKKAEAAHQRMDVGEILAKHERDVPPNSVFDPTADTARFHNRRSLVSSVLVAGSLMRKLFD